MLESKLKYLTSADNDAKIKDFIINFGIKRIEIEVPYMARKGSTLIKIYNRLIPKYKITLL